MISIVVNGVEEQVSGPESSVATMAQQALAAANSASSTANALNTLVGSTPLPTTAQTVTGAIHEVYDDLYRGEVSVTAESGETRGALLSRLFALLDPTKLRTTSKLQMIDSSSTDYVDEAIYSGTRQNECDFTMYSVTTSHCRIYRFRMKTSSEIIFVDMTASGTSFSSETSSDGTGLIFKIIY